MAISFSPLQALFPSSTGAGTKPVQQFSSERCYSQQQRLYNSFSDSIPSADWAFHLKSVKMYTAALSCLSILTAWLLHPRCSPGMVFPCLFHFSVPQLAPSHITCRFVDFNTGTYLTHIAPPSAL